MRSPTELIRLADRYARYLSEPTANPYLAWGRIGQIIRSLPPTQAFDLACRLIHALRGSYLRTFGGGTLAHLVHYHGETLIDWIEREAWRDVDFLTALSNAWVAREGVDPDVLNRLRVATGASIHIVSRSEYDAAYTAMFERWMTRRGQRRVGYRKKRSHSHPPWMEADGEPPSQPTLPDARTLTTTDITKHALRGVKAPLVVWFQLLLRLQFNISRGPRLVQHMAQGAVIVWHHWFLMTTVAARLVLPTLVVALCIISASPVTDLMLVALSFVLATVGAAVGGLVVSVVSERRRQFPYALAYVGFMSLTPYVTLIGLIARSEHGVIVAPAVLTGLVARRYVWRFLRRTRAALRHDK